MVYLTRAQFVAIQNHWVDLVEAHPELVVIKESKSFPTHGAISRTLQLRPEGENKANVEFAGWWKNASNWIATLHHTQTPVRGGMEHKYFASVWSPERFEALGAGEGVIGTDGNPLEA